MIQDTELGKGYRNPHGYQYWLNPQDKLVYASTGQPDHGFKSADEEFFPVFSPVVQQSNISLMREAMSRGELTNGFVDNLHTPYVDEEFHDMFVENKARVAQGGRERQAALISPTNVVTDILNVFGRTYGLKDRNYSGTELAQAIATPNLVIDIDTALKFNGMEKVGELQLPREKEIKYTRTHFETDKHALMFEISEESMLKNIHNPFQDSVTIAGTKVAQRKAFDVITELDTNLVNVSALAPWDTFIATSQRSTQNPLKDISRIITATIEGTGEGGTFNTAGGHTITNQDYEGNSFVNDMVSKQPSPNNVPGTRPLPNWPGVTLVQDQFIPQGEFYVLDVGDETCCALFEGPQRVATKTDELLNSQIYGIFSYHLARIINPTQGRKITGVATPVAAV